MSGTKGGAGAHPRATILLVEDNADDVLLIQRAFRKAQITSDLQIVRDGDAAVAYLAGTAGYADRARYPAPLVTLLDLKLPLRSGVEVLRWIRRDSPTPLLPVVVLTSSAERRDVQAAYAEGANSYLVKPVSFDALHEMMSFVHRYWAELNHPAPGAVS